MKKQGTPTTSIENLIISSIEFMILLILAYQSSLPFSNELLVLVDSIPAHPWMSATERAAANTAFLE